MALVLDRGQEDIQVAIIVEIRQQRRAAVGKGIDARDAGDVGKALTTPVEVEMIALISAEGEPLVEKQSHVVILILRIAGVLITHCGRHNVAPEKASGVLHGLTADKAIGGIKILPPVVVKIDEYASPGPTSRKRPPSLGDIDEPSV